MKTSFYILVSFFTFFVHFSDVAFAQDVIKDEKSVVIKKTPSVLKSKKIPSLFFTYWQHQAIQDAKKSRGVVRPPTQAELDAMKNGDDLKPKPQERDITLEGIVFVDDGDWTIWLNGKRVTPSAVPVEVLDLQVFKDYIEVKWLDDYTDQVFPIRLRAHQRFNLDLRMFLPG